MDDVMMKLRLRLRLRKFGPKAAGDALSDQASGLLPGRREAQIQSQVAVC
jgi:hypothetical protein